MLLDCELLQLTFQFKTYLPTGQLFPGGWEPAMSPGTVPDRRAQT